MSIKFSNKSNISSSVNISSTTKAPKIMTWYLDPESHYWVPILNASTAQIWLVSVITLLFAVIGFCLYLRVTYIIVKYKRSSFSNPFYTVVLYLAVPDCLFLFIQITFGFFITVIGYFNVPLLMIIISGYFGQICCWSLFALISVMGINRYIAICQYDKYKKWFSVKRVHVICCSCLLLGTLLPIVDASCQCFSFKADFAWKFECKLNDKGKEPECQKYSILFDQVVSGFFTTFIPLINFLTVGHYFIRKCQQKSTLNVRNQKKNFALLFQFVFISVVFVIYMAVYWVQDGGTINTNLDISLTLLSILNSSVNPYLYTAFSSEIRSKLLKSSKSVTSADTLSTKMKTVNVQQAAEDQILQNE